MKLKFPKKVSIGNYNFKVVYNDKTCGGSVDFDLGIIEIGTAYLDKHPNDVFDTICHEVSEVCHTELHTTYQDGSVLGNYKFFMDHKEFSNHNSLFCKAIQNFIA